MAKIYALSGFASTIAAVLIATSCLATPENADLIKRASDSISLYHAGKLQEAIDIEEEAVKQNSADFLPHALLSFLYWQTGNMQDTVVEGQKALRADPTNFQMLVNLASVYHTLVMYDDAIPLYERARKVAPHNWLPWIGLTRTYMTSGLINEARHVLDDMSAQADDHFEWNYQLGKAFLTIGDSAKAIVPLTKATKLATTVEEKSVSNAKLLVALIDENHLEQARALQNLVINEYGTNDGEPYVRVAFSLVSSNNPQAGKDLLLAACKHLKNTADSDAFFRLGRSFETHANQSSKTDLRNQWLSNAEAAFKQAIELNPVEGRNYLALAALMDRKTMAPEFLESISQAHSFDRSNSLIQFFMKYKKEIGSSSTAEVCASKKVAVVKFKVEGLTCGCQAKRIDSVLSGLDGIGLIKMSHLKPYEGLIVIDQSITSVEATMKRCAESAQSVEAQSKEPSTEVFELISKHDISSFDEVITRSQSELFGDAAVFPRQFDDLRVLPPESLIAGKTSQSF